MLIIKKRNIQKGFSLIELMVAVVILAIATLGIYQAYSVSFTGMADARDRTVATNYVRQAMEGIKNMDFDKIITQSRSYITGTKYEYEREVIVQESTNLKKVTTKVYWRNRNGNKKMVENGMSVHFMQTSEGTATRIMLIANHYNVLTGGTSTITAVIKDAKGNTVTSYSGEITFSITSGSSYGNLTVNPVNVIPEQNKGVAITTFIASAKGDVIIEASAQGLTPDSVTLKVTEPKKPVKINLTANRTYMVADTSSTSKITATIVDAGGETVTEITKVITFSVSGPGTLSAITYTAHTIGIAKITLTSNGTPGTITVTVSATGLEPGVVNVITGGKISLSASRVSVPVNETSEVTVTTKDVDGVPIKYVGTINLIIDGSSSGSGSLSIYTLDFDGSIYSNTVTFTASSEGTIKITATDQAEILGEGSIELTITEALVPHHIAVCANPSIIKAGGTETSTITARVKTADNITVISYNESVTFTTDAGIFSYSDTMFKDGEATAILYPPDTCCTAEIKVYSPSIGTPSITGSTEVGFYIEADHIELVASPQNIAVGGEICIITATIKDSDITVTGYSGEVEFSIDKHSLATLEGTNPAPVVEGKGVATIRLKSKQQAGTVKIEATSSFTNSEGGTTEIEGYLNIPIGITLELEENSVNYFDNTVSFDIDVQGADLLLEEMQISWSPNYSENLNKIEIEGSEVYSNSAISDTIIDIAENTTLSTGISTIIMYFNADMPGKEFDVIFNPNSGNYLVEFTIPT